VTALSASCSDAVREATPVKLTVCPPVKLSGVYDNYLVKRQILQSAPVLAGQLLLVDEVMRAGINMRKQ
jgi:hypothetical protein